MILDNMTNDEIDLSGWDSRTQELVKQYDDLPAERFYGWFDVYSGNIKSIEREYVRHIGMMVFGNALNCSYPIEFKDEKPELAAHLDTEAIKRYTEAKRIFELLEELDTTPCYTWGELAKQRIEICEMAINLRTRRLSDSSS